jgi:internalin A
MGANVRRNSLAVTGIFSLEEIWVTSRIVTMRVFLESQLHSQSGKGVNDLCLDHKLIADIHPEKFTEISGLELFPDLEKFSVSMHALTDVEGLRFAPLLRDLDLSFNEISDISRLSTLSHLQTLNLSHNEIASLEGFSLPESLRELNLGFNQLSDISGLEKTPNLEILVLNGNRRLTTLIGLPDGLRELHVNQCFMQDFEGLKGKNALEVLSISPSSIKGLHPLAALPTLRVLHLNAGRMYGAIDFPPLRSLTTLRIHKAQQITGFQGWTGLPLLEHLDISHSPLDSPPELAGCPKLKELEIKFSPLKNLKGIAELPALERLVLTGSSIPPQALVALSSQRPNLEIET